MNDIDRLDETITEILNRLTALEDNVVSLTLATFTRDTSEDSDENESDDETEEDSDDQE
jgi:hypothetical protein